MSVPTAAIVVAAGAGTRLGAGGPKAFVTLAGQPLVVHAARGLRACRTVGSLVVVIGAGQERRARDALRGAGLGEVHVCVGGASRRESVRRGLDACPPAAEMVAVHDCARPLVSAGLVERTIAALTDPWAAVAPGVPVVDTLKLVSQPGAEVRRTVDRTGLWAVQTPQVFRRATLRRAHEAVAPGDVGDDLELIERVGGRVRLVEGERRNLKVTYPEDLRLAEALLGQPRPAPAPAVTAARRGGPTGPPPRLRVGHGFDLHAFADDPGRPLRLGGVTVPGGPGLAGHSDADVVLHAVTDAVLGAAGLGDLGALFGADDPALAGADSALFLAEALRRAAGAGWAVGNVDCTVVAQRPRLGPQREAVAGSLARLLGLPPAAVNVKVTSTDRVGALGRGDGIACAAVALLHAAAHG